MSVSMWEAPRKEVTISKTSSSNRDNSRGSSIWSGWRNFDLLPEEVFRPSLGSASCPSRLPPQPSALPADHWQQAFPKAELSSSLDSLSQSSSSAESSANSSPERTSAAPWTQRPVGYERFHQGRASHTPITNSLCALEEAVNSLSLCQSTNLERNVRWLANANALPSAPIALSAPKNNCRRTTRRPITGGCIGNLLQSPSRQPLPVAASSFHCKTGTFRSKPQNTFPKPAQACFKPGLEVVAAPVMCPFCKKNGETPEFYTTHKLKDCWGRVICPVLRAYTCPNCGVSGDNAHTVNYCPYK